MSSRRGALTPARPTFSDWSRLGAIGACAGAAAGALFGLTAFIIQTSLTRNAIARYGDSAVDHGAGFLAPGAILAVCLLGGFLGILYAGARAGEPALARWHGLVFAAVLALGLQPLLLGHLYISSVVTVTTTGVMPNGFVKSGELIQDLMPMPLAIAVMTGLVLLMGLLIHQLLRVVSRLLPRLPTAAYVVVTCAIGLPGIAILGVLLLAALGAIGGE
jgi:hypothetical protein